MSDVAAVSPLASSPSWHLYTNARDRLKPAGTFAAALLIAALVVLVDGLVSQMRGGGSFRLEIIAGQAEPVSGPMGNARATAEDMEAFPVPMDAPVSFEFDGFFSSYWFGTGMWRGKVHVAEEAEEGTYYMAVGLRGTPASAHQTYTIVVASTKSGLDAQSLSFVRSTTGWNPFYVAIVFALIGLAAALAAIALGRRTDALLNDLGFADVIRTVPEGEFVRIFCVTGKREVPEKGIVCYDSELRRLGKVIFDKSAHGVTECLFVIGESGRKPQKGALVAFWKPWTPPRRTMRPGILGNIIHRRNSSATPDSFEEEQRPQTADKKNDASGDAAPRS